jgi:hypothetical protein
MHLALINSSVRLPQPRFDVLHLLDDACELLPDNCRRADDTDQHTKGRDDKRRVD